MGCDRVAKRNRPWDSAAGRSNATTSNGSANAHHTTPARVGAALRTAPYASAATATLDWSTLRELASGAAPAALLYYLLYYLICEVAPCAPSPH